MRPIRSLVLELVTMALGLQSLRCAGESPTSTDAATTDAAREDRGPAFGLPDAGPACAPRLGTVYACGTTVVGFPCGMPEGLRDGYLSESACSEICEGLFGESRENPFTCRLQPPLRGTTGALHCVRSCLPDGGPIPRDTGIGWEPIDGRRPEGFQGRSRAYATETVSEYLLAAAEMEAAERAAAAE